MALPYIVDDIESVPESLREHYIEKGGKFRLSVEGFDALLSQWSTRAENLITERNAALAWERAVLVDAALEVAISRAGANAAGLQLLPVHLKKRLHLETQGGSRSIRIMQADGETPMAGTGKNGVATFTDLMAETKEKFPSMFYAG